LLHTFLNIDLDRNTGYVKIFALEPAIGVRVAELV
jgi:hypothetical protein